MGAPETMRAVVLTGHGGPERLELRSDWPRPVAGAGEAVVRVGACGLNTTDVNTRTGWYSKAVRGGSTGTAAGGGAVGDGGWGGARPRFPFVQGADVAGTVVRVGAGADPGLVGRRVLVDPWLRDPAAPLDPARCTYLGSDRDGGFAEEVAVPAGNVHPLESALTDAELATFPTSSLTAENMLDRAAVGAADVVLVTGASGGVGSALVQLARRRGATVVALAAEAKHAALAALGASAVLPRAPADLAAALDAALGRATVTVVADVVGGAGWPQLLDRLAHGGRYVGSGAIAGPIVELDLRTLYLRDLTLLGATVVPPGTFARLVGYVERGELRPLLAAAYPLERLREAQAAFLEKRHVGNVVVTVADPAAAAPPT
jgi:NADPH:quinone reductase-like Zn-dependent oxidoreductase